MNEFPADRPTHIDRDDPLETLDPLQSYDPDKPDEYEPLETRATPPSGTNNPSGAITVKSGKPVSDPLKKEPASEAIVPGLEEASRLDETVDNADQELIRNICEDFRNAWSGGGEPSIADYIRESFSADLQDMLLRDLVVIDVLNRKQAKKDLDRSVYLRTFPKSREAVESALSHARSSPPAGYGHVTSHALSDKRSRRGSLPPRQHDVTSRYRPIRFHARGGLGVVFEAHDEELNREVALKEILPEHASNERCRDKFESEAEITGSLEHPGIVPVHGMGRYQDGQPYYAMRFIRGHSFRHAISDFHKNHPVLTPSLYYGREFRTLLRCLIDSCHAIHYAHEHGVIHRDIKPDNIMLGDYGETLVVDWGLAKLMDTERASEANASSRVSGSATRHSQEGAVGTPMYMSPEQALGKDALDGRADIYSLGAVLFNIVSGQHPVEGKSSREVVTNVVDGKIRKLSATVAAVPGPLNSVCRKAMHQDRTQRYADATALADDIERWLNDEIVHAHIGHEGLGERAGRLIRRYRSWTISGAAALVAITLIAIISALFIAAAREQERQAKQDAVQRFQDSRNAIDTWLVQSSDAMQFFPGTQSVRERLLRIAIEDYERLSSQRSRDPALELERGRVIVRLGDLYQMQNDYVNARSRYTDALRLFETGRTDQDLKVRFLSEAANAHSRLGLTWSAENDATRAGENFRTAIDSLKELSEESDDDSLPRRYLAVAYINQGEFLSKHGDALDAIESLSSGIDCYAGLGDAANEKSQLNAARARELLGQVYSNSGDDNEASRVFIQAIETLQMLVKAEPDHPDYLDALASIYISQAAGFQARGLVQQQLGALKSSDRYYRLLENSLPDVPQYTENLALTLTDIGVTLHDLGENEEAKTQLLDSESLALSLVLTYGQVIPYRANLASCRDALGQVLLDTQSNPEQAAEKFILAHEAMREIIELGDAPLQYYERLAIIRSHYAQASQRQENTELAKTIFESAITTLRQLIEQDPNVPRYSATLAHVHYRYGLMLHQLESEEALRHFVSSRDHWRMLSESQTASHLHQLAWLLASCPEASIRDPAESVVHANRAFELAPENLQYRITCALALFQAGNRQQANALLDEIDLEADRSETDRVCYVRAMLAHAGERLEKAKESYTEGLEWMNAHRPFDVDLKILRAMASSCLEAPVE